jgi:hypothetical protein
MGSSLARPWSGFAPAQGLARALFRRTTRGRAENAPVAFVAAFRTISRAIFGKRHGKEMPVIIG